MRVKGFKKLDKDLISRGILFKKIAIMHEKDEFSSILRVYHCILRIVLFPPKIFVASLLTYWHTDSVVPNSSQQSNQ